jgi:hypothetical protein
VAFGVDTGMIGLLATTMPQGNHWTLIMGIAFAAAVVLLVTSFVLVQAAMHPDTRAPVGSLLFWGEVALNSMTEFEGKWRHTDQDAYLKDLLEQIHRCSEILCHKFRRLRQSYLCLFWSILPWAVAIYLFRTSVPSK